MSVEAYEKCGKNFKSRLWFWKCVKSVGRITRPDYECGCVQRVQEVFQHQTMNVEACKDCRYNFKTRPTKRPTKQPSKRPTKWAIWLSVWWAIWWQTNWATKLMGRSGQTSYLEASTSGQSLWVWGSSPHPLRVQQQLVEAFLEHVHLDSVLAHPFPLYILVYLLVFLLIEHSHSLHSS